MTTRRSLLRLAAGTAGAAALAACTPRADTPATSIQKPATDLLFIETTGGLVVVDAATGQPTLPAGGAIATADWRRLVAAEPDGKGIRLITRETRSGQVLYGGTVRDLLEPRVISPDGRLIALATPHGGSGGSATYRPAGRTSTTIVVVDSGGERIRVDLPGNLEPEAFTPLGMNLYVLDYLPPEKPDRYRVRLLDLASKTTRPLLSRTKTLIPEGAEETMQGQGRQSVYDETRKILFTLYTHQPAHEHTRDLLTGGARPGAPHVHAFVHSLHLEQGWAYCVDLPAPFGEGVPGAHALALNHDRTELYVVDASTGRIAVIDPEALSVRRVSLFDVAATSGSATMEDATLAATVDGGVVVGAGTALVSLPIRAGSTQARTRITTEQPIRGIAVTPAADTVYVGQDGAVVRYDLASGSAVGRVAVPDLVSVRHVSPKT